jgi:hypothetical protein
MRGSGGCLGPWVRRLDGLAVGKAGGQEARRGSSGCGGGSSGCGGRSAAEQAWPRRATSRVGANAWRQQTVAFDLALFEPMFLQMFQQKWTE